MPPIDSDLRPHPPLAPHYQSLDQKQPFLREVFDASAPHYEGIASWGFFGTGNWYRIQALQRGGLKAGMKLIDVATGTGITARAAATIIGTNPRLACVDPSAGMLTEAKKRLDADFYQGEAQQLPVESTTFDFLTMGFALRHVQDLGTAFGEYFRVLKPGGRVLILDLVLPKNKFGRLLSKIYFRYLIPWGTRLFTGSREATYLMEYYWDTMDQMVPHEQVLEALRTAGFQDVRCHIVQAVFHEYSGTKPSA